MSRHRNIRNINIADELDDDESDYYDEEEEAPSAETSRYIYSRSGLNDTSYNNGEGSSRLDESNQTEAEHYNDNNIPSRANKSANKSIAQFTIGQTGSTPKSSEKKPQQAQLPSMEHLRIAKNSRANSSSPARMLATTNSSFQRLSPMDIALATVIAYKPVKRTEDNKQSINLVIVGHVDSGKSTLMGHLLYLLGNVDDKTMHKHKQESSRVGKSSFAFAWILDETDEERARGVTMDIARSNFESKKRIFNILDAPGHKDFIPNMITGASQADIALLVVNATRGEFETGFDYGGQTREHALLLRALGVSKVVVVVNKLDTMDWSRERYQELQDILKNFLKKQAGFDQLEFVPLSGLSGVNLIKRPEVGHPLRGWYDGPCLLEVLDNIQAPKQLEEQPLRIVINDVLKSTSNSLTISAKIEAGFCESGAKLFIMPEANPVTVKGISMDSSISSSLANSGRTTPGNQAYFAGDQVVLSLSGCFEPDSIYPGNVLCRGGSELLIPTQHFLAKIVVFDIRMPILKGTKAELFAHSLRVPCVISRLKCLLNKATQEVIKQTPRVITRNSSAIVEIRTDIPINLEVYSKSKTLSRFTLRSNNQTIAAGIMDQIL